MDKVQKHNSFNVTQCHYLPAGGCGGAGGGDDGGNLESSTDTQIIERACCGSHRVHVYKTKTELAAGSPSTHSVQRIYIPWSIKRLTRKPTKSETWDLGDKNRPQLK
jgi:hypothetical protein